jgi:hypothetical protein
LGLSPGAFPYTDRNFIVLLLIMRRTKCSRIDKSTVFFSGILSLAWKNAGWWLENTTVPHESTFVAP